FWSAKDPGRVYSAIRAVSWIVQFVSGFDGPTTVLQAADTIAPISRTRLAAISHSRGEPVRLRREAVMRREHAVAAPQVLDDDRRARRQRDVRADRQIGQPPRSPAERVRCLGGVRPRDVRDPDAIRPVRLERNAMPALQPRGKDDGAAEPDVSLV